MHISDYLLCLFSFQMMPWSVNTHKLKYHIPWWFKLTLNFELRPRSELEATLTTCSMSEEDRKLEVASLEAASLSEIASFSDDDDLPVPDSPGQDGDGATVETKTSEDELPTPPDGEWGWVIVVASFFIHVIADGVAYSFGVFLEDFSVYFNAGHGSTSLLGSLMIGVTWGSGKSLMIGVTWGLGKSLMIGVTWGSGKSLMIGVTWGSGKSLMIGVTWGSGKSLMIGVTWGSGKSLMMGVTWGSGKSLMIGVTWGSGKSLMIGVTWGSGKSLMIGVTWGSGKSPGAQVSRFSNSMIMMVDWLCLNIISSQL